MQWCSLYGFAGVICLRARKSRCVAPQTSRAWKAQKKQLHITSGQFIGTFPAGWSPQMVEKGSGNPAQNARNIQVKDL